ncbi:MAG: NADPH-dependent F420 reductase [Chitinophagales bacterium]|nr:NADPH-dependent F420 reductase [Hyphomicrobiales bacterium]
MKIGIIGAGNVGTGLGKLLVVKGHEIVVSFARSSEKVDEAAKMIGSGVKPGTPEDAARFGDVVILATPWNVTLETLAKVAAPLSGKILWDTTNALKPDMSGLILGTTTSAGEEVAKVASGAKVVKAISPFAELLHSPSLLIHGEKPGVFVCGGDANAKSIIIGLVDDIGAAPADAGPLSNARYTEPLGMLLVQLAYMQKLGVRIGTKFMNQS